MNSWVVAHVQALERALKRLVSQPLVSILSVIAIGIAIMLPLGFYTLMSNVSAAAGRVNTDPNINVYLVLNASEADTTALDKKLKALDNVAEVHFIARDAALAEMKRAANFADLLAGLEGNPLPHAFTLKPKSIDTATLDAMRKEISALPKVESVVMDFEWAQKLHRFATFAERLVFLLGLILALAVVFVTGNTIRLQILTQKDEIEVSQLIGATRRFIRRPFLYFGAIQGALAGVVAVLAVVLFILWTGNEIAALTVTYGSEFSLHAPDFTLSAWVILVSAVLGWLGAYISVSMYLRQHTPR